MGNLLYKPMESHDTSIQEENPEPSPSRLGHGRLDATPTPSVCVNNKVLLAGSDFDPRSPSSQIVRTPILIVHDSVKGADGKGKKSNSLSVRDNNLLNDPRSPSYGDYKRTPIHANTKKDIKMTEPADAEDPNESCSSIMSDSSILLQHVPENLAGDSSSTVTKPTSSSNSNIPRNILKRKQKEKVKNYESYVEKENMD